MASPRKGGMVLLTAGTEEIRAFLRENLREAFAQGLVVELVRMGEDETQ